MRRFPSLAALGALAIGATLMVAHQEAAAAPADVNAPAATSFDDLALGALRVLAYDRTFTRRATFVVATRPKSALSTTCGAEMARALEAAGSKVPARPLRPVVVPFSAASFDADLKRLDAGAVFLCPGLENDPAVIAATKRRGTLSLGVVPTLASVGLSPHGASHGLSVVLRTSRARSEGHRFTAPFLRYAHAVR